ncbi:MAG: peptide ABC transporter ATP-binding protein [Isosphaera sp.]|nr:peptide ABC transporter ATP-binding protein [Isosphaera sp.]
MPGDATPTTPLLSVRGLCVHFPVRRGLLQRVVGHIKAVDHVSFDIAPGQTLGLVGESGCGKTTVGRALLRLITATAGTVTFDGADVFAALGAQLRRLRRRMQVVFQDPAGSLNPRMTIESIVSEPVTIHEPATPRDARRAMASAVLQRCGMPADCLDRYPHQFSGGQRQRVGIARALILRPSLVVCDEPTSALDVSVQAQVLNLLSDLQRELGLSLLFISHDMGVIQHMCQRIAVMRAGRIVESGSRDAVINQPQHPYTRDLLAAVPEPDPARRRLQSADTALTAAGADRSAAAPSA